MEASLLQLYAPRDPLAEVLAGDITIRQFRVMCEGVPRTPDTPMGRALHGPWSDSDRLLHMATSVLQQLLAVQFNSKRQKGTQPFEPAEIPTPPLTIWQEKKKQQDREPEREAEQGLLAVLARNQQLNN